MNGIINIYKEKNMTSHDVVNILRKIFKTKRVGHTGTLDPMATGVLPICIGNATRVAEYLTAKDKTYIATIAFGVETDTQDSEGEIIKRVDLPTIAEDEFTKICESFIGKQIQIPPMYSAVKYKGKPLYKYAREGVVISELPQREIEVNSIEVISFSAEYATLKIDCSKGTYIRTLCADIAKKSGSGGHLIALERIKSGVFELEDAINLEVLKAEINPKKYLLSTVFALKDYPSIYLKKTEAEKIKNGMKINVGQENCDIVMAIYEDNLISVGQIDNNCFIPRKVFNNYE